MQSHSPIPIISSGVAFEVCKQSDNTDNRAWLYGAHRHTCSVPLTLQVGSSQVIALRATSALLDGQSAGEIA